MARSVKDLRDLICVSRLTLRDSDEEDNVEDLTRPISSMSLYGEGLPNASSFGASDVSLKPRPPSISGKGAKPKTTGVFKRQYSSPEARQYSSPEAPSSFDFRKLKPTLPPVCNPSGENSFTSTSSSRASTASSSGSSRPSSGETVTQHDGNFDPVLQHMDFNCVNDWLTRSNEMVGDLTTWCTSKDNFVQFAHFWLTEFPEYQRIDIIKMEVGILSDELTIAFANGVNKGFVKLSDLNSLVLAVLREYPNRLCSAQGPHVFLNILDTLSSERTHEYKRLLTDVKISTRNRDYAQWMLALRAFLLLNVWSNVVTFYRKFKSEVLNEEDVVKITHPALDVMTTRAFQAVRLGYVSVLHYLIKSGKVEASVRDNQGRTLVFAAIMHNQQHILHYLVTKTKSIVDVNSPCRESGNTPLHAAANWGYTKMVTHLLEKGEANVNVTNPKCDQATPLHLAVMQGHYGVCEILLEAGASITAGMSGITPVELAQDMGHTEIYQLLSQSNNNGQNEPDKQMDES